VLTPLINEGGGQAFIVNLSVDVSSLAIMKLARELNALYVDTVVEPWPGFYFDKNLSNERVYELCFARNVFLQNGVKRLGALLLFLALPIQEWSLVCQTSAN